MNSSGFKCSAFSFGSTGFLSGRCGAFFKKRGLFPVVLPVFLVLYLPFINKAFHIDDPLFLWSAEQILSHPLDFYGFMVNWYGWDMPAFEVVKNPPLASYYIAAAASVFGLQESALHAAFLIPAIVALVGVYRISGPFVRRPGVAALVAATSPLFLVSSTTVMCDILAVMFWTWSSAYWLEGIEEGRVGKTVISAFLAALCILAKYTGLCLAPLLFIFALTRKRHIKFWLWPLLIPVATSFLYEYGTKMMYGHGLIFSAASYAVGINSFDWGKLLPQTIVGLSFLGGTTITVLFFFPFLWKRNELIRWGFLFIGLVVLIPLQTKIGDIRLIDEHGVKWPDATLLSLFVFAGIHILAVGMLDFWKNRDAYGFLLVAWLFGIFVFACFVNWSINARSFLPAAPVVGILLIRRLDREGRLSGQGFPAKVGLLFVLAAALTAWVCFADYKLAGSARNAAEYIGEKHGSGEGRIWFQGHWGFQYYMQKEGALALDIQKSRLTPGDVVVSPCNNSNVHPLNPSVFNLVESIEWFPARRISTMNHVVGAGFYSDVWGPFPFFVGVIPPEKYDIHMYTGPAR